MKSRFLITVCLALLHSVALVAQSTPGTPPLIILDTDMGSDCDDVGALALLHAFADEGKAEILGVNYSSGKIRYGAGVIDAINTYYAREAIPVGAVHDSVVGDPVDKMDAKTLARNTMSFGHRIVRNKDAEEQTALNRSLLAAQKDQSVTYITIGHTKGLYDLLVSAPDSISPLTGVELVEKKIKRWVALGALKANNKENGLRRDWNFFFNGTAPYTTYLVRHFNRPIHFVNGGGTVMTGKSLENTPKGNIVREAYTKWLHWYGGKTLADQRPSWDLLTVYYAVLGMGDYFEQEKEGWLYMDAEKGCVWKREKNKYHHSFIAQKPNTDEAFAKELNEWISRPPKKQTATK